MKLIKEFYDFMINRESIRLRRLAGLPREEWTADPIMQQFSFTNVKRIHDRTTTLLNTEFYAADAQLHSITPYQRSLSICRASLLNSSLFRFFGTIEMARAIGWSAGWTDHRREEIRQIASKRMTLGDTVFTSAYMIPNCGSTLPKSEIVGQIIDGIWQASKWILDTNEWRVMSERLCTVWGVGPFMSKEILLDYILCTSWTPVDWASWTPIGPGGRRGAARVAYGELTRISDHEALMIIRQIYEARDKFWPWQIDPDTHPWLKQPVMMVELDLTDIQFQMCEFDKYSRVAEGRRPKRNFRPTIDEVTCG